MFSVLKSALLGAYCFHPLWNWGEIGLFMNAWQAGFSREEQPLRWFRVLAARIPPDAAVHKLLTALIFWAADGLLHKCVKGAVFLMQKFFFTAADVAFDVYKRRNSASTL